MQSLARRSRVAFIQRQCGTTHIAALKNSNLATRTFRNLYLGNPTQTGCSSSCDGFIELARFRANRSPTRDSKGLKQSDKSEKVLKKGIRSAISAALSLNRLY